MDSEGSSQHNIDIFQRWTDIKETIHTKSGRPKYYNVGEVWWCHLGQNIGCEENGKDPYFKRPVIIIRKFGHNMALVIPTSTKLKPKNRYYIPFSYHEKTYSALMSHIRTIDTKRLEKKIVTLGKKEFSAVYDSIDRIVFIQNGTP